jgi:hypothetical protein
MCFVAWHKEGKRTLEQAAAIALALESTRKEAATRVIEYQRLHKASMETM